MLYRPQRGSLEESMKEVVELESTIVALSEYLNADIAKVKVIPYTYDTRIDWDTYLVVVNGEACGFTNEIV